MTQVAERVRGAAVRANFLPVAGPAAPATRVPTTSHPPGPATNRETLTACGPPYSPNGTSTSRRMPSGPSDFVVRSAASVSRLR